MNATYYFVIATALAVLPIAFIYKITLERLIDKPDSGDTLQMDFFKWIAIAEILPIVFVIFGFINLGPVDTMNELIFPGLLVIILMVFGIAFIVMQRFAGIPDDLKMTINTLTMVGIMLINSIPLISIVALFLMAPR